MKNHNEKENTLLVTIGIPTYNRADGFLKTALQSAIDQTYTNIEIIVSDNCSSDNTEAVVKEFSDTRIKYFKHKTNIGANNNFNFCVKQACGEYFLLLHDDDIIDNDFIEVCVNAIKKVNVPVGVVFTGVRLINEKCEILSKCTNNCKGLSTSDFFLGWFKNQVALYLCSTLFNTKRLIEIGGFKSKTNHFQDVVAEVILSAKFGRVDVFDVKSSFRRHSSNLGGSVSSIKPWCIDCLYLLDIMCEIVPENKTKVRQAGMVYMCRKNYRLAMTINSPLSRIKTYLMIYRMFDYCYSPVNFLYSKDFNQIKNKAKNKIKTILGISRK